MSELIWLHEDALRMSHPVFDVAGATATAVFVWDPDYLRRMDYSFKRLVFLYETLCQLPLAIHRGDTVAVLTELMERSARTTLYVAETPNPVLAEMIQRLRERFGVTMVPDEPFVTVPRPPKLNRFFAYWKNVEPYAFDPNGGAGASRSGSKHESASVCSQVGAELSRRSAPHSGQ